MSTDPALDATEDEPFGHLDDESGEEEPGERFEEETLARDGYAAADRPGMTPNEASEGREMGERLAEERPDRPPRATAEQAEPEAGTLVGDGPLAADEAGEDPAAGPEQDAVHVHDPSHRE